jgi:hypothetical protein
MTSATFGISPAPASICEIDQSAAEGTAVTGEYLFSGTLPNTVGAYDFDLTQCDDNQIRVAQNAAGSLTITGINVLTVAVGSFQGTTTIAPTFAVSLDWKEIY